MGQQFREKKKLQFLNVESLGANWYTSRSCMYLRCCKEWVAPIVGMLGCYSGNVLHVYRTAKVCQFHHPAIVEDQDIESCK